MSGNTSGIRASPSLARDIPNHRGGGLIQSRRVRRSLQDCPAARPSKSVRSKASKEAGRKILGVENESTDSGRAPDHTSDTSAGGWVGVRRVMPMMLSLSWQRRAQFWRYRSWAQAYRRETDQLVVGRHGSTGTNGLPFGLSGLRPDWVMLDMRHKSSVEAPRRIGRVLVRRLPL